ncbi:MAG: translation initiation factor eIF-2B [Nanoarchaeota archaeon]|nr:translation initiation factor eIF-2B [Nanoarchaeota archaeon]MBU1135750.1 translation initiation factor eIF-2B [Nanoarchaeota archaeon]MBU2519827.1 translation initiation factor eIF-2B [Nanoarchaeota archaeon]
MVKIGRGRRIRSKIKKPSLKGKEPERTAKAISLKKIQGAREIAKAGIKALGEAAKNIKYSHKKEFLLELESIKKTLVTASPTTPMLNNALSFIIKEVDQHGEDNMPRYTYLLTGNYLKELELDINKLIRTGSEHIEKGDVIITNYHSDAVLEILKNVKDKKFSVIVIESNPSKKGLIMSKELIKAGVDVVFCNNSAIGVVMEKATKVIVGSQAILSDGSLVNKAGTLPLAMAAKKFRVPFYAVAETLKFDSSATLGKAETIEEMDPDEIIKPKKLKGAKIMNPAFDITPEEYIYRLITEKGIIKPEVLKTAFRLK